MSGMVGIFNRDGAPVDRDLLARMTHAMIRRGPDAQRTWADGPVGFGHAALFTTLEAERENQPTTLDGQVWITADARIDDWDSLRPKLIAQGRDIPRDVTDVQLILHAYHVWGQDCVDHLVGDFAFGIWDARQQRLFCARDHMGVKPFYYHLTDRLFVFASDVGALLAHPQVPRRINEARIADFLVEQVGVIDTSSTFFLDIFRFPPAQCRTIDRQRHTDRTYWALDPTREIRLGSDDEYAEAFLAVFTEAVRCRLRSPDRVGSMLSGGLDSSSIVGVARKLLKESGQGPLKTFSAITDKENDIETHYIKMMWNDSRTDPTAIRPQELEGIVSDIFSMMNYADDPADFPAPIQQAMYILAKAQGVKVLLDGSPGDFVTLLSSNYLVLLLKKGCFRQALQEIKRLPSVALQNSSGAWRLLFRYFRSAIVPEDLKKLRRKTLRKKYWNPILDRSLINPEFADRMQVLRHYEILQDLTSLPKSIRQEHLNWLRHPDLLDSLEECDRVAAFYSIEARHPYSDKRLIEFCLSLPWNQKTVHGQSKIINRRAMAGILPDEVRWRSVRAHLGGEFGAGYYGLGQQQIFLLLSNVIDDLQSYIDVTKTQKRLESAVPESTSGIIFQLMNLASLTLWLRRNGPQSQLTK